VHDFEGKGGSRVGHGTRKCNDGSLRNRLKLAPQWITVTKAIKNNKTLHHRDSHDPVRQFVFST
jgi:hypothetical protein